MSDIVYLVIHNRLLCLTVCNNSSKSLTKLSKFFSDVFIPLLKFNQKLSNMNGILKFMYQLCKFIICRTWVLNCVGSGFNLQQ